MYVNIFANVISIHCSNSFCFLGVVIETEQAIFEEVLHGELDFSSDPWPNISPSAKDLVRKMLVRDPKRRLTAHEVLCEFLFFCNYYKFVLRIY